MNNYNENNFKEILKNFDLSENESQIYITLLKSGESSVQNISKYSNIARTTCYHLLDSLISKGIISHTIKENIKFFQAVTPNRLVEILDEKKKNLQEGIPQLLSIMNSIHEKPNISIFEGTKGIKSVLKDVLNENSTIYHYGDIVSLKNILSFSFPQFINERIKRKIKIKIICKKEKEHYELIKKNKKEYREFVFIPEKYKFKSSFFIYSDKVIIFNITKEPYYAILIKNQEIYESQKNFFDLRDS